MGVASVFGAGTWSVSWLGWGKEEETGLPEGQLGSTVFNHLSPFALPLIALLET